MDIARSLSGGRPLLAFIGGGMMSTAPIARIAFLPLA